MPTRHAGSVEFHRGAWRARVTLSDGRRVWVKLEGIDEHDEHRARAAALATVKLAADTKAVRLPSSVRPKGKRGTCVALDEETFEAWTSRWLAHRKARGIVSTRNDESRLRTHVLPLLGARPVAAVTRREVEHLVASLDATVQSGRLSWKTAWNAWSLVTKAFREACSSKDLDLRVREDNPTRDVEGPDRGEHRCKVYLWPSEVLQLLSSDAVPLSARRLYAVAVYTGARAGELEAMDWTAIDLEHRTLHIHEAIEYDTGEVKATKGKVARRNALEPEVVPLLEAMHRESGGRGRVFPTMEERKEDAERLRAHLEAAGVRRAELFVTTKTAKAMTFHDLRSTHITWSAVRGDPPQQVQRRAGHRSYATTDGYVREAENVRADFGRVFPPLPSDLLGTPVAVPQVAPARVPQLSPNLSPNKPKARRPQGKRQCEEGDLNTPNVHGGPDIRGNSTLEGAPDDAKTDPCCPPLSPTGDTPGTPRDRFVASLAETIREASAAGDLEAARVAHDALGKLLRAPGPGGAAPVVDLATEREKRER